MHFKFWQSKGKAEKWTFLLTYLQVVNCLIKMIEQDAMMVEDNGTIFLACDTILNFLSNVSETIRESFNFWQEQYYDDNFPATIHMRKWLLIFTENGRSSSIRTSLCQSSTDASFVGWYGVCFTTLMLCFIRYCVKENAIILCSSNSSVHFETNLSRLNLSI